MNGTPVSTISIGLDSSLDGGLVIGGNGTYDEMAVYDTALNAARVQAHYDAGINS